MKIHLMIATYLVALLSGLPAQATSRLHPNEPTPEGQSFYVTSDTYVAMCIVHDIICGQRIKIPGSATQTLWKNCGIDLPKPGGDLVPNPTYECRYAEVDAPTDGGSSSSSSSSVPPVVVPTPTGWAKAGDGNCPAPGCTFDVSTRSDIKLCNAAYTACSSSVTFLMNPGVHYICAVENFKDFPAGADPYICISKPNPQAFTPLELPAFDRNLWSNVKRIAVPPSVSTRWSDAVLWRSPSGKIRMAYGTYLELAATSALGYLRSNETLNMWLAGQTLDELTEKENAFVIATIQAAVFPTPPNLVTKSTKLYWVASSRDFNILPIVGSIGLGVICDPLQSISNSSGTYYVVPSKDSTVKWTSATHLRVYGECTN